MKNTCFFCLSFRRVFSVRLPKLKQRTGPVLGNSVPVPVRTTEQTMQNAEDNSKRNHHEKTNDPHDLKDRTTRQRLFGEEGKHGVKYLFRLGLSRTQFKTVGDIKK
jgi:hypothetical protein